MIVAVKRNKKGKLLKILSLIIIVVISTAYYLLLDYCNWFQKTTILRTNSIVGDAAALHIIAKNLELLVVYSGW